MARVSVRYIVDDVDTAIAFYRDLLGFDVEMHPAPTFAMLRRGGLRLLLSAPSAAGGGGQILPAGAARSPAGGTGSPSRWPPSRPKRSACAPRAPSLRGDVIKGVGGDQVLVEDPSGNLVELFEPHPPT